MALRLLLSMYGSHTFLVLLGRLNEARIRVRCLLTQSAQDPPRRLDENDAGLLHCLPKFERHLLMHPAFGLETVVVSLLAEGRIGEISHVAQSQTSSVRLARRTRWVLELPRQLVVECGLEEGSSWSSDHPLPRTLPSIPAEPADEPPGEAEPWPHPSLTKQYAQREHLYASWRFAAGASLIPWQLRLGLRGEPLWMHAGGAYLIAPKRVEIEPLRETCRMLNLDWLRVEFLPECEVVGPRGEVTRLSFDARDPNPWMQRCRDLGLYPTLGRWFMTRTLLVDVSGTETEAFARLPTRIRYEIRATQRLAAQGELAFESIPAHRLDDRTTRAIEHLHERWLSAHPGAEDNLAFCQPLMSAFEDHMTAHLLWRQEGLQKVELLAVQFHVLWDKTNSYLFSETLAHAPNGAVNALIWHGTRLAIARGADILDLVSAFDPRYPGFRAHGRNYTPMKLRWHPTSVWMPPSVAIPGLEMPP